MQFARETLCSLMASVVNRTEAGLIARSFALVEHGRSVMTITPDGGCDIVQRLQWLLATRPELLDAIRDRFAVQY